MKDIELLEIAQFLKLELDKDVHLLQYIEEFAMK